MKLKILSFIFSSSILFAIAPSEPPALWEQINENFETGNLTEWSSERPLNLNVTSGAGFSNSYGVEVLGGVDNAHYIYRTDAPDSDEGYLRFMFHPGNIQLYNNDYSMKIADVRGGASWKELVALRLKKINTSDYVCFLEWDTPADRTNDNILISVENSWQEFLLGYKANDWIALWINGELKRAITNVTHEADEGHVIEIGQTGWAYEPVGTVRFDNVSFSIPAFTGVYYVSENGSDSNSGSKTLPWKTVKHAMDLLTPGGTVLIMDGIYDEQVEPRFSGTAKNGKTNWITYAAAPGHFPVLNGTNYTFDWGGLFDISRKEFIEVRRLNISNSPNDGVAVRYSRNIKVISNNTHETGSSGVYLQYSTNVLVMGNNVRRACNGSPNAQECISIAGESVNVDVCYNEIHDGVNMDKGGEGLDIKSGSSNVRCFGNYIHDLPGEVGLYIDAYAKHTHNIKVFANRVSAPVGIAIASEAGGLLENLFVYNNLVYKCGANGIILADWDVNGTKSNIWIVNNTLWLNGKSNWSGGVQIQDANAQEVFVRNNLCCSNTFWQISVDPVQLPKTTVDYNLLNSYYGISWTDEIKGDNFIEGNPMFVDEANLDFHLQIDSPAIDAGANIAWLSKDYDGNLRSGPPDIGAFEFIPEPGAIFLIFNFGFIIRVINKHKFSCFYKNMI